MVLIAFLIFFFALKGEAVSVPLRGLWFLSAKHVDDDDKNTVVSFRPLAGIMVLIG